MSVEIPVTVACPNCNSIQQVGYRFCSGCGQRNPIAVQKAERQDQKYHRNLKFLSIFAILCLVFVISSSFGEETLEQEIYWSIAFAVIVLVFIILQPETLRVIIPNRSFLKPLLVIFFIGISSGFIVSYLMDKLNLLLFEETYIYLHVYKESKHPLLMALIFIGVFPAVFEELAFRGFVFNNLQELAGSKSAIWGSAFLFGLVHLSLLSLIWIVPFGLLLSYFRNKYSTLFFGVIGHFTHNSTVVMIEYFNFYNY